ncbi:MAG TPA: peptidylprolyl isomerase [Vicinamibacterales bacterium]|jgi:peptidyl-prolyl cis-trans isomerase SurA
MFSTTRLVRPLVFVVALATVGLVTVRAEIIEQVLVKVNGDIITKSDLETRQVAALRQRGNQANMSDADLKKAIAEMTPQIIVETIDEMLLLQRGKDLGYKLTDDRFKQIVDNIKKENKIETEEQFEGALKAENLTLADLRRSIEKSAVITQVQQAEVLGRISVSEEEAHKYFDGHKSDFTSPATMMLREILVSVPKSAKGMNVAEDEAAKTKAETIRGRVAGGENFEKVVGEASDAASKANGGLIGPISKDDLAPELRKVFDTMKQGDVTPVLRTAGGYQIFKIETLNAAAVLAFDQARDQIADKVANTKRAAEFQKFLQKLRAQAIIDWKNADLKKLYDKRVGEELTVPAKG